jgi:dolichyl-diphosphooligosaccharide--protein glycosyltransferase
MSSRLLSLQNWEKWHIILLIIPVIIGIYIRVINPWESVFVPWMDGARLSGNDPWYYFRLIDSLHKNFPNRIWFDAFTHYPHGTYIHFGPFLVYLGYFVSKLASANDPASIKTVISFIPAVGGILLIFPTYLFTRSVFGKIPALISATLIVVIPGQLLHRSVLSFNDHHIWEVFWMLMTLSLFSTTFSKWYGKDYQENIRNKYNLLLAILTGISLGMYLNTWSPGFVIALIILFFVFLFFLIKQWTGWETDNLVVVSGIMFVVGTIVYLPFSFVYPKFNTQYYSPFQALVLVGSLVVVSMFYLIEILQRKGYYSKLGRMERYAFPITIILSAGIVMGLVSLTSPDFMSNIQYITRVVQPKGGALTIAEVQPFFNENGEFSLSPAWRHFSMAFFFAMPGMLYTAYLLLKERKSLYLLTLVWGFAMLIALAGQNRFAYYFGAVSAIFAGVMVSAILRIYFGFINRRAMTRMYIHITLWLVALSVLVHYYLTVEQYYVPSSAHVLSLVILLPVIVDVLFNFPNSFEKLEVDRLKVKGFSSVAVVSIVLLLLPIATAIYPTLADANIQSKYSAGGINKQWYDTLVWMRDNTPNKEFYEEFYYKLYSPPSDNKPYAYPEDTYSVMSWWDYGHWITSIAHRIPNANPFQQGIGNKYRDVPGASSFFTAFNESKANEIAEKLGVRYVITDVEMATGKFYAMATWAEGTLEKAGRMYYIGPGYVYITPQGQLGIAMSEIRIPKDANVILRINVPSENYYRTMEAKLHIMDGRSLKNYRMVYESGFESEKRLTLEMLYRYIYDSAYAKGDFVPVKSTGYVKVFEYVRGAKITGRVAEDVKKVVLKANVTTNQNRTFVYFQTAKVENGTYEFTVPYAQDTKYPVKVSPYTIIAGNLSRTISLTDEDVELGKTITLNMV